MRRTTTEKSVKDMNMMELAHNCMFSRNGWAWYRDFDREMDLRDFIREFSAAEGVCDLSGDNDELEEELLDDLQYDIDYAPGRVALMYRLMWALADVRETLMEYEDTGLTPDQLRELDRLYLEKCQEVAELKRRGAWIPVGDRLPEDGEVVQVTTRRGYTDVGYYDDSRGEWWTSDDDGLMDVIAWMPLAEPYIPEALREAGAEAGVGGLMPAD